MADQSVRVTNLPDSGSPEAVAFKLWNMLDQTGDDRMARLEFFRLCRRAAYGLKLQAE